MRSEGDGLSDEDDEMSWRDISKKRRLTFFFQNSFWYHEVFLFFKLNEGDLEVCMMKE